MTGSLQINIYPRASLPPALYQDSVALCSRAYEEDFGAILGLFPGATHVVAHQQGRLVSHALWIPRLLAYNGTPLLSAYVEAVATEPDAQGRGYASSVLRVLAAAITAYDVGALSPSDPAFYTRLGWELWLGPLAVVTAAGVRPMPEEQAMILRLPRTPPLDLHGTLAAPWREGEVW